MASVHAMVKQGGSETTEKDDSKLLNVSHSRCQRSLQSGRSLLLPFVQTPSAREGGVHMET